MQKQLHAIVRGDVQMVGFRYFVVQEAERLGVNGWVRNGDDGRTVEVVAEGDEDALTRLKELLHEGPSLARVDAVDADWSNANEGFTRFEVRY